VNPRAAQVGEVNFHFTPPAREISFNQNLTRNDGLLADAICEDEEVSFDTAIKQIDDFNRENLKRLSSGAEVAFKGIGKFNMDSTSILVFDPDGEANFLRSSFGLSSFHSPAIKRDSVEKVIEKKILKALPKDVPAAKTAIARERVNLVKYWPAAAVILLLIVSSTVLVKTNVLNNISISYSDLNPFADSAEKVYDPRVNDMAVEVEPAKNNEIDLWLESILERPEVEVKDIVKESVVKRFHVIGGCFEFDKNAEKLMRRLKRKGFDPQLVGKNRRGLQRVAFGSYETRGEARKALRKIKRKHMKSAWLYVA